VSGIVITIGRRIPPLREIVETVTTRDQAFSDHWGTRATPPPGTDWAIADFSHDRRTTFARTRLIPLSGRP
jgi:hypothetical protein